MDAVQAQARAPVEARAKVPERRPAPVLLACRGLAAGYGDLRVLGDVNLEVRQGELVALIGVNGAGKTTTLRALTGLIRPWTGEVVFKGQRVDGLHPGRLVRLGLAQVPEGRGLFPGMSVRDNLLLGAQVAGRVRRADLPSALEQVFALFPVLHERQGQPAGSLSGGEQQIAAIARALVARPDLLMLDEPSLGLAPRVIDRVFGTLDALRRSGTTVLLVEQDVRRALALADWAYVLERGRVVAGGPGADLAAADRVTQAYLGVCQEPHPPPP